MGNVRWKTLSEDSQSARERRGKQIRKKRNGSERNNQTTFNY